jgi:predicted dehydrogenase
MQGKNAKTIRVGVVGCGVVATAYYLPYLLRMPGVEITTLCDIHSRRLNETARLFKVKQCFADYYDMIRKADIEAVLILTAPGTHVPFTLAAVEAGKHVLLQKPMSTNMDDANAIVAAVRRTGVKALIEPSAATLIDPIYRRIKELVDKGVLGDPYWFSYIPIGPDRPHPSLSGNPYGAAAFYNKDSGGYLFDFPYAPTQIATLLGSCRSVMGTATISLPDRDIVPEEKYDEFLESISTPESANYWDYVLDAPRTKRVKMEAPDNVFSLYEMASGWTGIFHAGRMLNPMPRGSNGGGLEIIGTEGNLIFGRNSHEASIISRQRSLLPDFDADGWHHIDSPGDHSRARWPQPVPGGFNYYHESTKHFIDCIREDADPIANVEWGRHITEMMYGAIESARTGQRYQMTTTLTGLVQD